METSINGKAADWTPAIWKRWYTVADEADPKWIDVPVFRANYFTPRPAVDEYNRGSREEGFVFIRGSTVFQAIVKVHQRVGGDVED
jgi:hypothetical protein